MLFLSMNSALNPMVWIMFSIKMFWMFRLVSSSPVSGRVSPLQNADHRSSSSRNNVALSENNSHGKNTFDIIVKDSINIETTTTKSLRGAILDDIMKPSNIQVHNGRSLEDYGKYNDMDDDYLKKYYFENKNDDFDDDVFTSYFDPDGWSLWGWGLAGAATLLVIVILICICCYFI